jgi:hypothetical protein
LKLTNKQLALKLNFGEDITLKNVQELIDQRSVIFRNAEKKGETTIKNRVAGEIK